ncbi:asparaginase [Phenylobacterium sp.]|uniref:asparaginase n=1 Tax=Phenylobacterium sp. TaxID=1871053 RepID=UPI002730A537|nr:asparaginase domain-containing protein [Phenylobacterium sp.]MDP1616350.1 asparaginase domain-containing protein [Phenylobacterium sp.]MDP1988198.1 asparaginase domain-containing protein [Phenylobacterium sp.]
MSHVLVLDAGGTISSQADARGVLGGGQGLSLGGEAGAVRLSLRQVHAGLSDELSLADAAAIVRAAQVAAAEGADDLAGIVVAHGTDTMEETAFLADLVWTSPLPLVFTGAQRAPAHPEFDGAQNLADAAALAADPAARDRGVLLAFGGRVMPARGALKAHTSELAGFASRQGEAGSVEDVLARLPRLGDRPSALPDLRLDTSVEILAASQGSGGGLIDAAVSLGARGIVLQALGRGNASPAVVEAVARACAAGVVVLVASRCPFGQVAPDYASGARLAEAGAIFSEDLGASQARILLSAILGLEAVSETASARIRAWLAL